MERNGRGKNSIHVCVAGTVGSWWFEPDDTSVGYCDANVFNAFTRTMTTSFGSICFGSLLVAILQALRALAQSARENGDMPFFACIAECILGCLASLLEYFNQVRSYVFVLIRRSLMYLT
jgi:Plasma-membrane choline transporter